MIVMGLRVSVFFGVVPRVEDGIFLVWRPE